MRLAFWRRRKATQPQVLITPAPAFIEREFIQQQTSTRDRRKRTRRYRFLALVLILGTVVWQLAEHRVPVRVVAPASTHVVVPRSSTVSESPEPTLPAPVDKNPLVSSDRHTVGVETDSGCEWVKPFSRANGIQVQGYWRSKPGQSCSLVESEGTSTENGFGPKRSKEIYVGPRGGRYHYSKNGKKVYEHK